MVFIQSDRKAIHIHVPHHIFLFLIIILLGLLAGYFGYKYYITSTSYMNNKELQGLTYTPPQIKNEIHQMSGESAANKFSPITGTVRVPILMYHYIEYVQDRGDTIRISLNITPYTLEQQLQTLIAAGYTFMTNAELDDVLDGQKPLPVKPILLTFDDGYRDFATDAYPILKKYNVKATEYIVPGFLDWSNYMFKTQLDQIAKDDLIEIAAHTVHHAGLAKQSLKTVTDEVFLSKVLLEDEIHHPVVDFAYPYGSFDDQAVKVVKDAGFRSAVSTLPGIDQGQTNRYFLFRLRPGARTGQGLLNWLNQATFSAY